jgi:hypothetical protein
MRDREQRSQPLPDWAARKRASVTSNRRTLESTSRYRFPIPSSDVPVITISDHPHQLRKAHPSGSHPIPEPRILLRQACSHTTTEPPANDAPALPSAQFARVRSSRPTPVGSCSSRLSASSASTRRSSSSSRCGQSQQRSSRQTPRPCSHCSSHSRSRRWTHHHVVVGTDHGTIAADEAPTTANAENPVTPTPILPK